MAGAGGIGLLQTGLPGCREAVKLEGEIDRAEEPMAPVAIRISPLSMETMFGRYASSELDPKVN